MWKFYIIEVFYNTYYVPDDNMHRSYIYGIVIGNLRLFLLEKTCGMLYPEPRKTNVGVRKSIKWKFHGIGILPHG
jgi:hypothetical protein